MTINFISNANASKLEALEGKRSNLDNTSNSIKDEIRQIKQNISDSKKELQKLPKFKLGYGLNDNYKGLVRLKAMHDGKFEVRGESKSKFVFLHQKRHENEQGLAKKHGLNTMGDVKNLSSNIAQLESSIKNQTSKLKENESRLDKLSYQLQGIDDAKQKLIDSTRKQTTHQKTGLVAVYGTNVGAKAINNAIRQEYGAKGISEPNLSNLFKRAQQEWNGQNKNSAFSFASSEDKKHTIDALSKMKPKELANVMFSEATRDGSSNYYRGTILSPDSALNNAKSGQLFESQFILSCSPEEKSAKRFADSTYHSSTDRANVGKPAIYEIIGRAFNIGAGESQEVERNFKPGTIFEYINQYESNGVVHVQLNEVNNKKPKSAMPLLR